MRQSAWMLEALGLATLPLIFTLRPALADEAGISTGLIGSSRWEGRLSLGDPTHRRDSPYKNYVAGASLADASVLGDYYFGRSLTGVPTPGGFRATSGLIFGPRSWAAASSFTGDTSFSMGRQPLGASALPLTREAANEPATLPYLGVGYTGLRPHSGWSYSADLGLVAQSPGGLKLMRGQNLDDALREMRLAPLLQLGASYSF